MNRYALTLAGLRAAKYLAAGLLYGLALALMHAMFPATRHNFGATMALALVCGLLNYFIRQWAERRIKAHQQALATRPAA